jgi:hypothetical protein
MTHRLMSAAFVCLASACSGPEGSPGTQVGGTVHNYQATASVGDFLVVSIDKAAHTVAYHNRTNGLEAAAVAYTVDANGVYTFSGDPNHHLLRAVELEDQILVVDVDHAGPGADTRALAIGAATQSFDPADVGGQKLTMQFRTQNGGMEVGHVNLTRDGQNLEVDYTGYWPRGAMMSDDSAWQNGPGTLVLGDPGTREYITISDEGGEDTLFKVAGGFALDMSNGNMFILDRPASGAFDPARAGSYQALAYRKTGARGTSGSDPEPGTPDVVLDSIAIDAAGHVTVSEGGSVVAEDDLVSVADVPALVGAGRFDAARSAGLFTFAGTADVFVVFTAKGLLFTSFSPGSPTSGDDEYDYSYGAAVKL